MTDTAVVVSEVADEDLAALKSLLGLRDHTKAELTLFALNARRLGLDPFARQIYSVKRAGRQTIQTSIDGLRSIAERTGQYAGSPAPTFGPTVNGYPEWASVTVLKLIGGQIVGTTREAAWAEYAPSNPSAGAGLWHKMPRVMLSKCAEAQALRAAFPLALSGVYSSEEMDQSEVRYVDTETGEVSTEPPKTLRDIALAAQDEAEGPQEPAEEPDTSLAAFGPAEAPEPSEAATEADRLSLQEFNALRISAQITNLQVKAHAYALFPEAKSAGDLNDEQRAELWEAIANAEG